MKPFAALAISATMLFAQSDRASLHSVTAVRHWSLDDVTRIAIEVSGDFNFRTDRLHNPERVYFDILNARPRIQAKRIWSGEINDKLVQRVRAAETSPGTTRVVVDLAGPVEINTSQLSSPHRLIIEVRAGRGPVIPSGPAAPAVKPPPVIRAEVPKSDAPAGKVAPAVQAPPLELKVEVPALKAEPEPLPDKLRNVPVVKAKAPPPVEPVELTAEARRTSPPAASMTEPMPIIQPAPATPAPGEFSKGARRTSTGGNSLTRALGLKVGRIVIDAGHGGHDQGTQGPHGLLEKELVLDVSLRLGKLIEERMDAEVIYTRSDDTFIPLEGRTAIANQRKADLFLSIHANSSPIPRIAGMETFYLNFTDSRDALDVASRENASSQKSIFELQDIIQKITLHEKAGRIPGVRRPHTGRDVFVLHAQYSRAEESRREEGAVCGADRRQHAAACWPRSAS